MDRNIAVVGLGYVGLQVAAAFGKLQNIVGFDISKQRIEDLRKGFDYTQEVSELELASLDIIFTSDAALLSGCDFFIITVPTPIYDNKEPDLSPLINASELIGKHLTQGAIVVYESTVYPGTTEEVCVPILEQASGLRCGQDFYVGYSPERINPGDKERGFSQIKKIVAGQPPALSTIVAVYESVVKAGIYIAPSIKVAEAAKIIENTQRDVNIALMNELAIIFNKLNIDTSEVIEAASSKWNFMSFHPGLVGGHCIGVDPYYLIYKAESEGYQPQLINAGRRVNDSMSSFIVSTVLRQMAINDIAVSGASVTVLGLTFKENIPDIRNSKIVDVIMELKQLGMEIQVSDPIADPVCVYEEYGLSMINQDLLEPADVVILGVPHYAYVEAGWQLVSSLLRKDTGMVVDIKSVLEKELCPNNIKLWRL